MVGFRPRIPLRDGWQDAEDVPLRQEATTESSAYVNENELESERRLARLTQTIEGEIIPRLVLAHRSWAAAPALAGGADDALSGIKPSAEDVSEVARLVIAHDAEVVCAYVDALRSQGVPLEAIFLDLLAPTARRLGEFWVADICSFTDVTVGLCRLQQVLRELSRPFQCELDVWDNGRKALLVAAPGEQHTFGVIMVAEFLRRAGWHVSDLAAVSCKNEEDIVSTIGNEWFDVVGLSLSCDDRLEWMASAIRAIRRASYNPSIGVLVGGRVFVDQPELVLRIGADATAADGREAVERAEELLVPLPVQA